MRTLSGLVICAILLSFCFGCNQKINELNMLVCPGKDSVSEVLDFLKTRCENAVSLMAKGSCRLELYQEDDMQTYNLTTLTVVLKSSDEIYLQGDITWGKRAIILGSNETDFWFAYRLKDNPTLWLVTRSQLDSGQALLINPETLLEALGFAKIDMTAEWTLNNEGPNDVLTKSRDGVLEEKIYIYSCDYNIRKIEYFDTTGQIFILVEMDDYQEVTDGFSIPCRIKITTPDSETEDSLDIDMTFSSLEQVEVSERQEEVFFNPPPEEDYSHVLILQNGEWIEK